jgi:hypothetical protein
MINEQCVNPNPYAFRNRYCVMGGWQGKQIMGGKNLEQLQEIIYDNAYVTQPEDEVKVPSSYEARTYDMTGVQKEHYEEMAKEFITLVENQEITVRMAINAMQKLQQITSGFIKSEEGRDIQLVEPSKNPKLKMMLDILDNEYTDKALVFYFHKEVGRMLEEVFQSYGCMHIRSGLKPHEVESIKAVFNNDDRCRIGLCQIVSGKYGHTLLGTESRPCDMSIYFEQTFSLDDRVQSEFRNQIPGKTRSISYIDCIGSGIEQKIAKALVRKEDLSNTILQLKREDING